jgi:putative transposase
MAKKRRSFDEKFKARVAVEALRNQRTVSEIAAEYGVHPNQVRDWKKQLLSKCPELFADGRKRGTESDEQLASHLYEEIGRLKVELDWLQRKVCL